MVSRDIPVGMDKCHTRSAANLEEALGPVDYSKAL